MNTILKAVTNHPVIDQKDVVKWHSSAFKEHDGHLVHFNLTFAGRKMGALCLKTLPKVSNDLAWIYYTVNNTAFIMTYKREKLNDLIGLTSAVSVNDLIFTYHNVKTNETIMWLLD
jgi:hypothetical protein